VFVYIAVQVSVNVKPLENTAAVTPAVVATRIGENRRFAELETNDNNLVDGISVTDAGATDRKEAGESGDESDDCWNNIAIPCEHLLVCANCAAFCLKSDTSCTNCWKHLSANQGGGGRILLIRKEKQKQKKIKSKMETKTAPYTTSSNYIEDEVAAAADTASAAAASAAASVQSQYLWKILQTFILICVVSFHLTSTICLHQ